MALMDDRPVRDGLLEALERILEESRRLRGQNAGPGVAPRSAADEVVGDLRRTTAPALTWPFPL